MARLHRKSNNKLKFTKVKFISIFMHMFLIFLNIYLSYKVYQSFVICERSFSSKHGVIYNAPSLGHLWVEQ